MEICMIQFSCSFSWPHRGGNQQQKSANSHRLQHRQAERKGENYCIETGDFTGGFPTMLIGIFCVNPYLLVVVN